MPDLAEVAAELYAVEPEEFVAARTEQVKQARSDGDRALATAVSALPKPTLAAWLVNTLVREQGDQVHELISLGDALREAQQKLAGPELRRLSRQRQELIAAFTSMTLAPAEKAGRAITADLTSQVQETLGAAVADPQAGQALLSGRLAKGLSYVGLGEVGPAAGDRPVLERRPRGEAADAKKRSDRQREQLIRAARAEVERAEGEAVTIGARLHDAELDADRARTAVAAIAARVEEIRGSLGDAEQALTQAETDAQAAAERVAAAQQAADEAVAASERARVSLAQAEVAQDPLSR